jgi:hypothetical protein
MVGLALSVLPPRRPASAAPAAAAKPPTVFFSLATLPRPLRRVSAMVTVTAATTGSGTPRAGLHKRSLSLCGGSTGTGLPNATPATPLALTAPPTVFVVPLPRVQSPPPRPAAAILAPAIAERCRRLHAPGSNCGCVHDDGKPERERERAVDPPPASRAPVLVVMVPRPPPSPPMPALVERPGGGMCLVCNTTGEWTVRLCESGHLLCTGCLLWTIQRAVAHNTPTLSCVLPSCGSRINADNVHEVLLRDGQPDLAARVRLLVSAATEPGDARFPLACPVGSCGGVWYLPDALAVRDLTHILCPTCGAASRIPKGQRRRRRAAFRKHDAYVAAAGSTTGDYAPARQALWEALYIIFNTRRCPSCHAVAERISGCDHMTCRCGTQFCWQCAHRMRSGGVGGALLGGHNSRWRVYGCTHTVSPDHPALVHAARAVVLAGLVAGALVAAPFVVVGAAVWLPFNRMRNHLQRRRRAAETAQLRAEHVRRHAARMRGAAPPADDATAAAAAAAAAVEMA